MHLYKKYNFNNELMRESKKFLVDNEANDYIGQKIIENKPFMVGRFGSVELESIIKIEHDKIQPFTTFFLSILLNRAIPFSYKKYYSLNFNAGFYPINKKSLLKFNQEMYAAMEQVDVLGSWVHGEANFANIMNNVITCNLSAIEPYYHNLPWSENLKGKNVLIIHPFIDSIKNQYENNREKIFKNLKILPAFNIKYIKAVQTISGNKSYFSNWFNALDWMTNEAIKQTFDIAIIGCGAYGFPLAARLKKYGRQSIHLGGATQILFGIKGVRWDTHPIISKLYNEYWIRPSLNEKPKQANEIENGCYW